jgi:dUTP pyrophosphatase
MSKKQAKALREVGSTTLSASRRRAFFGEEMELRVKRLTGDALSPSYAYDGDAGLDLCAAEEALIPAGTSALVKTGIALALPPGTEGQIRPRSGLALNHCVTVLNSPGTIDEGYRGEVAVILINHGRVAFSVQRGTKIAQLVIAPRLRVEVVEVSELQDSTRGVNGFGSTGA